jgi:hypothetical protein
VLSTLLASVTTPFMLTLDELAVDRPRAQSLRRPPAMARRNSLRNCSRVLEFAAERLGDHPLVAAPVFAEQQAQLLGFDHAGGAACLAVPHQRVGDVARHPFLIGEAMADRVDQAGDAAKAVQATAGQVGDVRDAAKRHQVVRADAMHGNAAHHHQVAALIGEAVAERGRRVEVVAAEQAALPEFAHALRGSPMCAASGAMPQAASRSPTARSKAAGSKACWRGMPISFAGRMRLGRGGCSRTWHASCWHGGRGMIHAVRMPLDLTVRCVAAGTMAGGVDER